MSNFREVINSDGDSVFIDLDEIRSLTVAKDKSDILVTYRHSTEVERVDDKKVVDAFIKWIKAGYFGESVLLKETE